MENQTKLKQVNAKPPNPLYIWESKDYGYIIILLLIEFKDPKIVEAAENKLPSRL